MLLMIDNYDSFTYNIVRYFFELGAAVRVVRNDEMTVSELADLNPSHLVISPGPRTPDEAGVSVAAIQYFAGKLPILGICLGHQSVAQAFGGKIVRAKAVMHGKTSAIYHQHSGVFTGLPSPFIAARYHSLVVDESSLVPEVEISAWTQSDCGGVSEVMAIRHKQLPIEGVQFHPEAVLSQYGHQLLKNFLTGVPRGY